MTTTVDLDEELLKQLEQTATRHGETLAALIEEAVRQMLDRQGRKGPEEVELPTFRGRGLQPIVDLDLDNSAGLLDLMGSHAPD
jgi:Ribbon-helix-helix protein, copG family